ncbi:MAG: zinc-binding dehydrogenase [candidate division Zixibacteria bacterium]|nr:zinc-binding dehydrogenase [candidate division Zixibacteria bacterium]
MKVATIFGERKGGLVDKPVPKACEQFVVVKLHAVPMCTEYKTYRAGHVTDALGHEAAGEVVEVAQSSRVKMGDRVVVMSGDPCGRCMLCLQGDYIHCQHFIDLAERTGNANGGATYAQYLVRQDWQLVPIPGDVSYIHAGMACCGLGPTFNAMKQMEVGAFDTVLITGMGPVGLGGVINATFRGARVIVAEMHAYRAALALALGAETVIDPSDPDALSRIMDLTDGRGADKAVDCSGSAAAQRFMIDALRRKGQASFVGEAGDLTIRVSADLIRKGIVLRGVWHYNLADTPVMMRLIRDSHAKMDRFITHTFPMSRVQDAWELQLTGNCGKIVLEPWG